MLSLNKTIIPVKTSVCVNRHEICVMQSKLIDENKQKHMFSGYCLICHHFFFCECYKSSRS